jgi:hypothetical protein
VNAITTIVPERERRRLVSTLGLLASDQDGEVLAAARAACRLLKPYGFTPAEFIAKALEPAPTPKPDYMSGFTGGSTRGTVHGHQGDARLCLVMGEELLNDWEKGFLHSLIGQRSLSPKQADKLRAIKTKIERGGH